MQLQQFIVLSLALTAECGRFRSPKTMIKNVKTYLGARKTTTNIVSPPLIPPPKSGAMTKINEGAKITGQVGMGLTGVGTLLTGVHALFFGESESEIVAPIETHVSNSYHYNFKIHEISSKFPLR